MTPATPRRDPTLWIVVAVAACAIAALLHVYVRLQVIQLGYDLSRESKLRHDLAEQNQRLRLELAVRKDPSVIERRAREELHMEPPDPRLIRKLTVDGVSRATHASTDGAPRAVAPVPSTPAPPASRPAALAAVGGAR